MTHPLTWEIIAEIASDKDIDEHGWYHFNPDHLRATADWQLEQVTDWLRDNLHRLNYIDDGDVLAPGIDVKSVIDDLKEAMRPTEDS